MSDNRQQSLMPNPSQFNNKALPAFKHSNPLSSQFHSQSISLSRCNQFHHRFSLLSQCTLSLPHSAANNTKDGPDTELVDHRIILSAVKDAIMLCLVTAITVDDPGRERIDGEKNLISSADKVAKFI